jgi:hypothetical protein
MLIACKFLQNCYTELVLQKSLVLQGNLNSFIIRNKFMKSSKRKKAYSVITRVAVLFVIAIFASCKTITISEVAPFPAIGDGADVYVFLPVDGNKVFLDKVLGDRTERQDIKEALKRTKKIYAGLFSQATSPRKKDEVLVCAVGNYPANLAGMAFKEKNGWTKYIASNSVSYYSGGISAISIPNNSSAFLALADEPEHSMKRFLEDGKSEKIVPFSENFDRFVETTTKNAVGIFIKNPNFFIAKMLGTDLQLPVTTSEIYLLKDAENGMYSYNFSIETGNKMTAFALSLLLRTVVNADVKTADKTVLVENGKLSETDLGNLLQKIFN